MNNNKIIINNNKLSIVLQSQMCIIVNWHYWQENLWTEEDWLKTRKLLNMHKMLHPKADVERLLTILEKMEGVWLM